MSTKSVAQHYLRKYNINRQKLVQHGYSNSELEGK